MIYAPLRNKTTTMLISVHTRSLLAEAAPAVTDQPCRQNPVLDGSRFGKTLTLTARCVR